MKEVIRCENVWKIYGSGEGKTIALRDINFSIYENEFVIILGPSGSGKSTLLHIIGCLDRPTKGNVYINGINIDELDLVEVRRKYIGFVFQQFNLIPNLTVLENVALPLIFQGISKEEREIRAKNLLEYLGLGHRLNYYPNQLSGGQKQRVAIARALVTNPKFILADEPTGNLDSKSGQDVMELLSKLHQEGRTIIMVTHDPRFIKYGTRIIKLVDGQIVEDSIN
jgi:putative ABC transport system ATP-binding protein